MQTTVKLKQLIESYPHLQDLSNKEMTLRFSYKLKNILSEVRKHVQTFEETRIEAVKNRAKLVERDGQENYEFESPEDRRKLEEELNELTEEEVEVNIGNGLTLDDLEKQDIKMSANALLSLEWLVRDDDSDDVESQEPSNDPGD